MLYEIVVFRFCKMDLVKAGGLPPPLSMPQTNALITRLESLIMSLTDTTKRDDVKNKDLRVSEIIFLITLLYRREALSSNHALLRR